MLQSSKKPDFVSEVNTALTSAVGVIALNTRGTKANDIASIRKTMRNENIGMKVVNNKLTIRALENTNFSALDSLLVGPTTLIWSDSEPGKPAKMVEKLLPDFETLEVKGICLGGELIQPERLESVAKLPSRDEALSQLAGILQAPITKLASTLNEVPTKFARLMQALKASKES